MVTDMKKLNNKGFAISTIIYGISIMGIMLIAMLMANMSAIRKNNNDFAKTIEEDLTRFSMAESTFGKRVDDSGNTAVQPYTVPEGESGWFKIELWGAQGGGGTGGRGAYTSGVIHLNAGEKIYFYVGKMGASGLGGESTEVRVSNSNYLTPNNDRIMVAAGGGANPGADGGTLYGQNSHMASLGGILNITEGTYELKSKTLIGYPESGYPSSTDNLDLPHVTGMTDIGDASPKKSNAGGYGYKGGGNGSVGGASCIAGAAGCFGPVTATIDGAPKTFYFLDSMMLAGVREGDGQARVSKVYVGDSLPRKNKKFNEVVQIKDCIGGPTVNNQANTIRNNTQLDVRRDGVALGYTKDTSPDGSLLCTTFNLTGGPQNIDEVAIWHTKNKVGGVDIVNHRIYLIKSSGSFKIKDIISSPDNISTKYNLASETETPAGIRISAYQHDGTETIPAVGDYYIIPIITENKVMSAREKESDDANAILYEYYNGDNRQKWSIEKISDTRISPSADSENEQDYEYKIVELARYKALAITLDENMIKNTVSTLTPFNSYARNEPQLWRVYSLGDGTYAISTVVDYFRENVPTGGLVAQTRYDDGTVPTEPSIIISQNKDASNRRKFTTQRFKLIDINYG